MKKRAMKNKISLLLIPCLLWINCDNSTDVVSPNGDGSGDVDNTNFTASRTFSFEVNVTAQTRLRVESINGNVVINGKAGEDSAVITGERIVGSESVADAEAHLEDLEVSVSDLGNEILVETTQPTDTQGRSYTVNYNITLPIDLEVMTTSINGNVSVDSIGNLVTTNLTNGQVTLTELSGNTNIDLENGIIEAQATLPLDGSMDMDITNGSIELAIPQNTSANFTASVVNGIIDITNLTLQNAVTTSTSVSGTLGNGRGTISLSTLNGNITVTGS